MMENTPALKYNWPQSHCSDLLLRAIDVDARNIVSGIFSAKILGLPILYSVLEFFPVFQCHLATQSVCPVEACL